MPQPPVVFAMDSPIQARCDALLQLEQALHSGEVSAVKTQVLRAMLHYARGNLLEESPFQDQASHFVVCQAIFSRINLPDLFFLQEVINQLSLIRDETSVLKKTILSMALNYKRPLMLPLIRQMEKASLAFNIAVLFMQDPDLNVPRVAACFSSELTAEARVERILNARLAWPAHPVPVYRSDEDFDESIDFIANFADQTGRAALRFFNRVLLLKEADQPSPLGSNKQYQPKT